MRAGIIPKKIPMAEENNVAIRMVDRLMRGVSGITKHNSSAPPMPRIIPMMPPIAVMIADSARNCHRIELVRAPRP